MWAVEHSVDTRATRAAVWALWADVDGRPGWDRGLEAAALDGVFADGAHGFVVFAAGRRVPLILHDIRPLRGFAVTARLPFARLHLDHELHDGPGGRTRITHRISLRGPLAPLWARTAGRDLARELPGCVRRLARLAADADAPRAAAA